MNGELPNQLAEESRFEGWNYNRERIQGEALLMPVHEAKLTSSQ